MEKFQLHRQITFARKIDKIMGDIMIKYGLINTVQNGVFSILSSLSEKLPFLLAFALGILLLYAVGFAQTEALHDAAHDTRHSFMFPCH